MSGVASRLAAAMLAGSSGPVDPGLVPTAVAAACVEVLGVDGAGLSLIGDLRVPLAASSVEVRRAEQLQTTLGEGPCLTAVATAEPLAAGPGRMRQRWPVFHSELTRQSAFQSVVALPLGLAQQRPFGALDLYFVEPEPDHGLLEDPTRSDLVQAVTSFLAGISPPDLDIGGVTALPPSWPSAPPPVPASLTSPRELVAERLNVWTAVGMLMAATGSGQPEALAVLRGHAFHHTRTLDEVAHLITSRRLPVEELLNPAP